MPSLEPLDGNLKKRTPAEILDPLYKLATCEIPKGTSFTGIWNNSKCVQNAFKDAKELLQKAITLNFPRPDAPLALTTDASKVGLGATLDQWVDGAWRPLGMWSKVLKPQQQGYSTYRRELMGILHAMRHFNEDINGRPLIIFTDHLPIIGSFNSSELQAHDPQALSAINEIGQFTSDICHKAGKDCIVPDLLSRPSNVKIGKSYLGVQELDSVELSSPHLTMAALEEVALHTMNHVVVQEVDMSGHRIFCEVSDPANPRPLIPCSQRSLVCNLLHHMDHPGQKETARRITREYYWPGMRRDIGEFVKTCHPCQLAKQSPTVNPGIGHFPVPDRRFEYIHIDIVGPLPESQGHRYLLSVLDRWLLQVNRSLSAHQGNF